MTSHLSPRSGIKLDCECVGRCSILCCDFDKGPYEDRNQWTWDFYTNAGYDLSWRHRLRIVWNLLRGQDHYFHGTVHFEPEMRRLRDYLNDTLEEQ